MARLMLFNQQRGHMKIIIEQADLNKPDHQKAVVELLNTYAMDLDGYKRSLPEEVLNELIPEMKKFPTTLIYLAQADEKFAGMAICFMGFSTFYARPLINIHDFTVLKEYRHQGIGKMLVKKIEEKAEELNCCKLTLEVQEINTNAIRLYESCGFEKSILDESAGQALFLSKYL